MTEPRLNYMTNEQTEVLFYSLGGLITFLGIIVVITTLAIRIPYNIQQWKLLKQESITTNDDTFLLLGNVKSFYTKAKNFFSMSKNVLTDGPIIYHILYFITLILGLAYHHLFFSFSLSYLIYRSNTLK
jgi:hypothetical protein